MIQLVEFIFVLQQKWRETFIIRTVIEKYVSEYEWLEQRRWQVSIIVLPCKEFCYLYVDYTQVKNRDKNTSTYENTLKVIPNLY